MRKAFKAISNRTAKPLIGWYLRRPRLFAFSGIKLFIPPGVFHPGFFFSSRQLVNYLATLPLEGKLLFEMGSGSGFVSIYAAKQGAIVTAADSNPLAVETSIRNANTNGINAKFIHSDLFASVPPQQFDLIIVNPPYYPKDPADFAGQAWYAGEDHSYFRRFFLQANAFAWPSSRILMVLSDECDLEVILGIARANGWKARLAEVKRGIFETGYIFEFVPSMGEMA
jgi:release factor glutamine methyltransferase